MNYEQVLSQTFLFKGFEAEELHKLAAIASEEQLQGQTELFREGEEGGAMYIIAMGTMRVMKRNKDGETEEIAILGTGSYFGEMALITDEHQRTATMTAQESTTLISLSREAIEKLCAEDAHLAHHFYRALARGLARRLSATTQDAANYRHMWRLRGAS